MIVSSKLPGVGTTIFTVMSALAQEHGAINLAQGFPDFASSQRLNELVAHYMRQGYNQYAPMAGLPLLRQRIAEKIDGLYGVKIDPVQEVTITAGATQGIFTAIGALVNPGDEVIIVRIGKRVRYRTITSRSVRLVPFLRARHLLH